MIAQNKRRHRNVETALTEMTARYEGARADYQATKKGRFNRRRKGLPSRGGSADYHIRSETEYYDLIENAYDLERNDAVVGQLVDRRVANVVQGGFRFEPKTGDKKLDVDLKDRWADWADEPDQADIAGEATFHDFEYAADWTQCLAGDCGISVTEHGPLQFFEPYLIRRDFSHGEDTFLGVDMDADRTRLRYWIAEDDPTDPYDTHLEESAPVNARDEFGRRQFFHVYNQKRMTLTRGITAFAPMFELTGMLEDVNFAKLVQQQIVSCVAFLIEESTEASGLPSTTTNYGGQGADGNAATIDTGSRLFDEVEPGMEVNPGPGKKVTGFSPQVPNAEYFQQYRLILQLICGGLDLPLAIGMLDGSETNFHGFIGAINEAKKLWKRSQTRLIKRFHRPCTIAKLHHFAADDKHFRRARKRLGRDFFRFQWHPPVWQSVKPLDDTNDRLLRLRNAIVSPSKIHTEIDSDYEEHVTQTVTDNALAIRAAKKEAAKINGEFDDGQPVHWAQLYPMPMAEGTQSTTTVREDNTTDEPQHNRAEVTT